ncbi:FecR family protein [Mesorhizobium sp. SB112]|uniref:FecR family protein n=1 Tax=Mesorhizobium sp. SB112 TaxID=3151853 RepID=UPI003264A35B
MGHQGADDSEKREDDYVHDDPVVDEALDWFTRLRNRESDSDTRREFVSWLNRSPRHEEEFRNLEAIWGSSSFLKAVKSLPVDPGIRRPRFSRWAMHGSAAAAAMLLAAGVWQYPSLIISWQADYVTVTGDQSTIQLPDGSTMMLNTASAVAVDFENGRRRVQLLRGEAFFDVQHDLHRPFVVKASFGEVEVRGTAFSVRTDAKEDDVFLERGKVQVYCLCDRSNQVELHPGEGVSVTASAVSPVRAQEGSETLAWREGRIAFETARLGDVLDELRRYYSGRIVVMDDRVNRMVVTGNYRLDNVEGAIRTLADAAGVGMTRIPGGLIILR